MKLVFTLFAFFITLHLTAQAIEKYYPNGVLQQQGKYKAYSKKSTYGYAVITLKTGVWTHYYENEQIALKEEYKVRWKKSKPIGIWEYYTVGGDLLKYGSKCLIELQITPSRNRRAILRKHRSLKEEREITFKIVEGGILGTKEGKGFKLF